MREDSVFFLLGVFYLKSTITHDHNDNKLFEERSPSWVHPTQSHTVFNK